MCENISLAFMTSQQDISNFDEIGFRKELKLLQALIVDCIVRSLDKSWCFYSSQLLLALPRFRLCE